MKRSAFVLAGFVAALVAGCAAPPPDYHHRPGPGHANPPVVLNPPAQQASPLARSFTYVCEDLTTIVVTEGQPSARATLNSGLEIALARRASGPGFRYGGAGFDFEGAGGDALWHANGKTWRCRMK